MARLTFIDVLRGIAILSVMFHHLPASMNGAFGVVQEMGGRGVDLFFVLSGFLIGSTCLNRASTGASCSAQVRSYWLLRSLRIWPLYYPLLALLALGWWPFSNEPATVLRQLPWHYLFFLSNDIGQPSLELGVLWSLAIEEQFYLLVGVLIWVASRRREMLEGVFVAVASMCVLIALRYRADLHQLRGAGLGENHYIFRVFFATISRVDQLGIGLLTAVIAPRFNRFSFFLTRFSSRVWSWLAVAATIVFLVYFPMWLRVGFTLVGFGFAGAVLFLQRPSEEAALQGFERWVASLMAHIGKLSFGLYLFHPITRRWVLDLFSKWQISVTPDHAAHFMAVWFVLSWLCAFLSYQFYESRILSYARKTANRWIKASTAAPRVQGRSS